MSKLTEAVKNLAEEGISPAGKVYRKISLSAVRLLAGQFFCSLKEVEKCALLADIVPERYERNLGSTKGVEGQLLLLSSRVAVIGLGGLGGLAAELLARMGVGTIILVDGDFFSESNLNRQLLSTEDNLQQKKADVAQRRIAAINAAVETVVFKEMVSGHNIEKILQGCHVALDCLDNIKTRFLLQETCQRLGIPMIHGAIAQFYGQVSTIFPGDPGLKAIYSSFNDKQNKGIETQLGNPAATPALIAAWQVQETIKVLLKIGEPLRNRLLFIDTLQGSCETIALGV